MAEKAELYMKFHIETAEMIQKAELYMKFHTETAEMTQKAELYMKFHIGMIVIGATPKHSSLVFKRFRILGAE